LGSNEIHDREIIRAFEGPKGTETACHAISACAVASESSSFDICIQAFVASQSLAPLGVL
jgi:hypothetical protein